MDQEPTNPLKKPTPWVTALYSMTASLAGTGYLIWRGSIAMDKARGGVPDPEITRELWSHIWVGVAILVTAFLAAMLNLMFVARGGRKWTLIPSAIGILISVPTMGFLAYSWMKLNGQA